MIFKSRFIEMFGDPVSNPKQWPAVEIIKAAPIKSAPQLITNSDRNWLLNLDAIESQSGNVLFKHYVGKDELDGSICSFTDKYVLYSKLRPYLNKVVIPDEPGFGTTELLPMLPKEEMVAQQYLASVLRSDSFVQKFTSAVAGTKMPRVSMDAFRKFQLPLPPLSLQNDFGKFLKQVDKSKFLCRNFMMTTKYIRQRLIIQHCEK